MPLSSQTREDLQTRLAEISGWETATRDDTKVAGDLYQTRSIDRIYPLNEAAFFDELFHYIREIGAWPLLENLDPEDREGALYPSDRAREDPGLHSGQIQYEHGGHR